MSPELSVIVVAYGKEHELSACLDAVEEALAHVSGQTEAIVVVNMLDPVARNGLENSGRFLIVDPGTNVGFAAGVNAGLVQASGEWIALINDDCVVERTALAELLAAGEQDDAIGSVAARIVFAHGSSAINSAGIEIDQLGVAYERLLGEPTSTSGTDAVDVFGASATAALYRRRMLAELGGFDESFFAYLEDADLAWRARMSGWRATYAPSALVRHRHSSSLGHRSATKYFLVGRNRVRMLAKNATRRQLLRHGLAMVLFDLTYVVYAAVSDRTLAPLRGRMAGLREWRTYRGHGEGLRRPVRLGAPRGIAGALERHRSYRKSSDATPV